MSATDVRLDAVQGVHFVGGVPLDGVEDVFRTAAGVLGPHLRRIPDGEVGMRRFWVGCQLPALAFHPAFELVEPGPDRFPGMPTVGLRASVDPAEVAFGSLGYASAAALSYEVFARLQSEGVIPEHCRFQVSLPGPLEVVAGFVQSKDQLAVEGRYAEAMWAEIDHILAAIPPGRLALQWDTCLQVGMVDGWWAGPFDPPMEHVIERLARQGGRVPAEVELGYHLCYGDYQHRHFVEPPDLSTCVAMANAIAASVGRTVDWIHMPVPIERDDDDYFAPLGGLALQAGTELYLGLVHYRDGAEGARRRIGTARKHAETFGVATECGMGRRPAARGGAANTLEQLLAVHAEVSAPVV
ncbi:MAG: hypothetical protein ACR2KK_14380 [Acidimicrobiales bacterium]